MEIADTDFENIIQTNILSHLKTIGNFKIYQMLFQIIETLFKLKSK